MLCNIKVLLQTFVSYITCFDKFEFEYYEYMCVDGFNLVLLCDEGWFDSKLN